MLEFLIYLLVIFLVFGALHYAIVLVEFPAPFHNIALAVLALVFALLLLGSLTGAVPLPKWAH